MVSGKEAPQKLSRREFDRRLVLFVTGLGLVACQPNIPGPTTEPTPTMIKSQDLPPAFLGEILDEIKSPKPPILKEMVSWFKTPDADNILELGDNCQTLVVNARLETAIVKEKVTDWEQLVTVTGGYSQILFVDLGDIDRATKLGYQFLTKGETTAIMSFAGYNQALRLTIPEKAPVPNFIAPKIIIQLPQEVSEAMSVPLNSAAKILALNEICNLALIIGEIQYNARLIGSEPVTDRKKCPAVSLMHYFQALTQNSSSPQIKWLSESYQAGGVIYAYALTKDLAWAQEVWQAIQIPGDMLTLIDDSLNKGELVLTYRDLSEDLRTLRKYISSHFETAPKGKYLA